MFIGGTSLALPSQTTDQQPGVDVDKKEACKILPSRRESLLQGLPVNLEKEKGKPSRRNLSAQKR